MKLLYIFKKRVYGYLTYKVKSFPFSDYLFIEKLGPY